MASSYREEISRLELLHAAHPEGLVFPHLADAYRRAGHFSQAEDILSAGLRRHEDYASAHVVLGRLRLDQGRHEESEAAFRRALDLDPQNQVALECLGDLSERQGRFGEALHYYRQLLRAHGDDRLAGRISALERRAASASSRRGGNGGGAPAGTVSVATAGSRPGEDADEVVTETMAELYSRQGLHHRAASVYRRLLQRYPGDPRLIGKLAAAERAAAPPRPTPPQPPARTPTIRSDLRSVLAWRPSPAPRRTAPQRRAAAPPRRDRPAGANEDRTTSVPAAAPRRTPEPPATLPRGRRRAQAPAPAPASAQGLSGAAGESGESGEATGDSATDVLIAVSDMLVGLLEFRDPFFRGSSSLTRLLATSVGRELGVSKAEQVHIALAAVLRDLGRLALGGKLLPSPRVTPSPEGRRRIERHVDLALQLMEGVRLPEPVRLAVRHHHERWDGAGYPDALGGGQIPRLARILAVVDSFVAMVSPRPYRLPRKVPEAAAELQQESGTRYDPEVVNALMRVLANREQPNLGFVQRHHILLVDPDQPGAVVTAAKLCSAGYLAEVTVDADTARERLRRVPVAALVVSGSDPESAARFVRDIRRDPLFASLPIVVTDAADVGLRVRLLERGADVCFPPGVEHAELQGTLGALVRRALAPRGTRGGKGRGDEGDAPWLALQGDVEDFPLTWLLQVMKYDGRTAAIGIRTAREQGVIYLRRGDAVHARVRGGVTGEAALREMLEWKKGRFTVQPDARTDQRTISTSLMHLLLNQAVHQDHAEAGIFGAVSAEG